MARVLSGKFGRMGTWRGRVSLGATITTSAVLALSFREISFFTRKVQLDAVSMDDEATTSPGLPSLQSASEMREAGLPTRIHAAMGKDSPGAYIRACCVSKQWCQLSIHCSSEMRKQPICPYQGVMQGLIGVCRTAPAFAMHVPLRSTSGIILGIEHSGNVFRSKIPAHFYRPWNHPAAHTKFLVTHTIRHGSSLPLCQILKEVVQDPRDPQPCPPACTAQQL